MNNRNKECWCGSGKKYKKCHLRADEVFDEAATINKLKDKFNGKKLRINPKLIAIETMLQEASHYKFTER